MSGQASPRSPLAAEVEARFGVLPNFFCTADAAPEVVQHLWAFAKSGYLDNPLPSLFKERLFVHLSRFCSVRYCIVRHTGFLLGRGRPAGDALAQPHTIEQVVTLLRRKGRVEGADLDAALARLEAAPCGLPEPESRLEEDVFAAATELFLEPQRGEAARRALVSALGPSNLELLTAYLAFVRTAHYWTLTHPELAPEEDVEALLRDHQELALLLMEDPEAARCDISARLLAELKDLRAARSEFERIDRHTQMLRLALDATGQGAWDYDVRADRPVWDAKTYELFGVPADAPLSYASIVFGMVHPDDREAVKVAARAAMDPAGDGLLDMEHRVVHPGGQTRWLSHRGRTLFEDRGEGRRAVRMLGTVRDVTEAHLAADALRREREALQTIFDTIPVMITLYDPQANMLLLNREFERLSGWSTANLEGVAIMEACYPDEAYREQVRAFMEDCRGWMDIRMRTRDGRFIDTSWANVRLSDDRSIGIGIDVSLRKAAERASALSEERLRLASEAAGFGVYDFDVVTRRSVWSTQLLRILGREDHDGAVAFDDMVALILPEDRAQTRQRMEEAMRRPAHYEMEFRIVRPDGAVRWVLDRGETFAADGAANGPPRRGAGTVIDITERKAAEARLRESEQRFRGIYENAGTGIAIADLTGRFQSCNPAYAAMLGYSEGELRQLCFRQIVHADDLAENMVQIDRLVTQEVPSVEIMNRYVAKDGRPIWVHKRVSMLRDAGGRLTHFIALVTDMTERKRAEEHRQLLVNELNHRVKNTLAVVQAIAQQTFRASGAHAELFTAFQNRLAALAAAHNLLSRLNWEQASLEELARETTAASFAQAERIRLNGPRVVLAPKKAVTFAMALHELCTNAMKYGALSVASGRIDLEWQAMDGQREGQSRGQRDGQRDGRPPGLRLTWRESGGPPVAAPEHKGFGSRIIEQALAREFDGEVAMDFRPDGLVVTLDGALPELAGSAP